ncbi:MAG: hypothetical protein QW727_03375 [Candidatus Pacearchaeota archaeon]
MQRKYFSRLVAILTSGATYFINPFNLEAQTFNTIRNSEQIINEYRKETGKLKKIGYEYFGKKYYFLEMGYPVPDFEFSYNPLVNLDIPLKNPNALNKGADKSGWVPIPIRGKTYFRGEYHFKDLDLDIDGILNTMFNYYIEKFNLNKYISEEATAYCVVEIKEKSKIHAVVFDKKDFSLLYHPGIQLASKIYPSLNKDSDINQLNNPFDIMPIEDNNTLYSLVNVPKNRLEKLVGVFNGTFWNDDSTRTINGIRRYPGLIINEITIDEPIDDLGTIAIYSDGSVKAGSFKSLPKENIIFLRQNEFPVIENENFVNDGLYPYNYREFTDDILRSYFLVSKDRYFGYAWTTFCPPALSGELFKKIGFDGVVLLDIHPAIASVMRSPVKHKDLIEPFNRKNSYYFVPDEGEIVPWYKRLLPETFANLSGSTIQYNYFIPVEGEKLKEDFFSVYIKD